MCSPVGGESVAGFLIPTPCAPKLLVLLGIKLYNRTNVGMVMNLRVVERTEPEIEIKISRNGHLGQVERRGRIAYANMNFVNVSDGALLYETDSRLEFLT